MTHFKIDTQEKIEARALTQEERFDDFIKGFNCENHILYANEKNVSTDIAQTIFLYGLKAIFLYGLRGR